MSRPGRLIALEGVDGCGKSTQARMLAASLGALSTAEPGGTELGAALRRLLLDVHSPAVSPRTEALLVAADRAQHVDEVVAPALDHGRWVVTERFSGSTLAYQGYGRGLDLDQLRPLVSWAARGVVPDLTVVIDVPVALARERMGHARPDRLEGLDEEFHQRVRAGYLELAAADPSWVVLDGADAVDEVNRRLEEVVAGRLGPRPTAGP